MVSPTFVKLMDCQVVLKGDTFLFGGIYGGILQAKQVRT